MRATGGRGGGGRRARAERAGQATESAVAGCGSERSRGFITQDTPPGKEGALRDRRSGTMQRMLEMVEVPSHPPERFESVLEPEPFAKLANGIRPRPRAAGRGRTGTSAQPPRAGVVELLLPLMGYAKGAGVDARWAVIEGDPEFFKVTKRIHDILHGFEGDDSELDDAAREVYERRARVERRAS